MNNNKNSKARVDKRTKAREYARANKERYTFRNANAAAAIRGGGFDERLLRHGIRHKYGVSVTTGGSAPEAPLFEQRCNATFEAAKDTFRSRGDQYGDTWRDCQHLALKAVIFQMFGLKPTKLQCEAVSAASLVDVKYQRFQKCRLTRFSLRRTVRPGLTMTPAEKKTTKPTD